MRVVVSEFISLDGITQAPGEPDEEPDGGFRHGGWSGQFFEEDVAIGAAWARWRCAAMPSSRVGAPGSIPVRLMAGSQVTRSATGSNGVQKYVVSDTLTVADTAAWTPTTIIRPANLVTEVWRCGSARGGDITVLGSSAVVRALMAADLIDELQLILEPIVLGGGKSIFPYDTEARVFELVSTTRPAHRSPGLQLCPGPLTRSRGSPADLGSFLGVVNNLPTDFEQPSTRRQRKCQSEVTRLSTLTAMSPPSRNETQQPPPVRGVRTAAEARRILAIVADFAQRATTHPGHPRSAAGERQATSR